MATLKILLRYMFAVLTMGLCVIAVSVITDGLIVMNEAAFMLIVALVWVVTGIFVRNQQ